MIIRISYISAKETELVADLISEVHRHWVNIFWIWFYPQQHGCQVPRGSLLPRAKVWWKFNRPIFFYSEDLHATILEYLRYSSGSSVLFNSIRPHLTFHSRTFERQLLESSDGTASQSVISILHGFGDSLLESRCFPTSFDMKHIPSRKPKTLCKYWNAKDSMASSTYRNYLLR